MTIVGGPGTRVGRAWGWRLLLLLNVLLALPTAIVPGSRSADFTYLAGEAVLTGGIFLAAVRMPARERPPWLIFGAVALSWLIGDTLQRVLPVPLWTPGTGPPDLFWLGSYPLQVVAVSVLIGLRQLPRSLVRDIHLDVLIISAAAGLGAWLVIIEPGIDAEAPLFDTVAGLLYSLGDVVIFSLALTLLLTPGSRGVSAGLLVAAFGATLPLDFLSQPLGVWVPPYDSEALDAGFLVINTLIAVAALHPSRERLTALVQEVPGQQHLQVWRIGVLGLSLAAVSVANALTAASGLRLIPGLAASLVVALAIILRFYRISRAQEQAAAALRELAEHDQLTGVANRELLRQRLPDFVTAAQGLLVYIDLDGFKQLNDTHGHHAGDVMLCAVGQRLGELVRAADTVARVGGDEFIVLLNGCREAEAHTVSQRILEELRAPVPLGEGTVRVGASIGVVVLDRPLPFTPPPDHEALAEDVLRSADSAMYDAKRRGGGVHIVRYEPSGNAAP